MYDAITEQTIDAMIDQLPLPRGKLFVGDDGNPEPLKIKFADIADLRDFLRVVLSIGIDIAGRGSVEHE